MKFKDTIAQHCGNCQFSALGNIINRNIFGTPELGRAIILCRRYPSVLTTHRQTIADDWCGEYSRSLVRTIKPLAVKPKGDAE